MFEKTKALCESFLKMGVPGFNDPEYFARVIKQQFGCTPRELKTYGK